MHILAVRARPEDVLSITAIYQSLVAAGLPAMMPLPAFSREAEVPVDQYVRQLVELSSAQKRHVIERLIDHEQHPALRQIETQMAAASEQVESISELVAEPTASRAASDVARAPSCGCRSYRADFRNRPGACATVPVSVRAATINIVRIRIVQMPAESMCDPDIDFRRRS